MTKEEAKQLIAQVCANFKGTLQEHNAIQEAFKTLTKEEESK
jgi:hypothetical protein